MDKEKEFELMCLFMMQTWRCGPATQIAELEDACAQEWPRFGEDFSVWKESAFDEGQLKQEFKVPIIN